MTNQPIFVWRSIGDWSDGEPDIYSIYSKSEIKLINYYCKYCGEGLYRIHSNGDHYYSTVEGCKFCGWATIHEEYEDEDILTDRYGENILKEFNVTSPELSNSELGSFMKKNYNHIHSLPPRRFEILIADIFKNQGYKVEITKETRDGGYDLMLLNNNSQQTIVEIKRYKQKIGVDLIRQLRGVQFRDNTKSAMLVTSSSFTRDAINEASAKNPISFGFELSLLDANDILKLLDVYSDRSFSITDIDQLKKHYYDSIKEKEI